VDCTGCGSRYDANFTSCPHCGRANSSISGRKSSAAKLSAAALGIIAVIISLVFLAPAIPTMLNLEDAPPVISILPPFRQEPKVVPQEELVAHALELINKDRVAFGFEPVKLSSNAAAQVHAEDVFRNKQISHWMSNGEKPYMTYSRYGGLGSVGQNVAIAGFNKTQYDQCIKNTFYDCEKIDPIATIEELQYEMMYNDKECCDDGHRNNILNSYRTDVSIGIVYDEYYLAVVQNFENNYGIGIGVTGGQVQISGELAGSVEHVAVYYDPIPTPEVYEENKKMLSYSTGELVAVVAKPLPPGFFYEQPEDYRLLVARQWDGEGKSIDISFDLARTVEADGVYTITIISKPAGSDETFEAASYSVVVDSESEVQ
jgi:uncharacterized protein YkwD